MNVGGYKVFVQSTSASGTRHLPAGSMVLYEVYSNNYDVHFGRWQNLILCSLIIIMFAVQQPISETKVPYGSGLRPLWSTHFDVTQVEKDCSLKEFCTIHGINYKRFAVFLEFGVTETRKVVRDVILAKKVF